jgi:cilia- and flagella-associated protein 43
MSEEQRKILEDFEARQKALLEEKEKYRKGLELELKKLRQDVADICRGVDEKIMELFVLKMATQMQVHVQELYSLRLVLVLMEDEDDKRELSKLRSDIAKLNNDRTIAQTEFQTFSEQINLKRSKIEQMRNKEKDMDKQFKRIMQDMSPGGQINSETMTTLTSLYKSRSAGGGGGGEGSAARNSLFAGGSSSVGNGSALDEVRARMEQEGGALPQTSPFYEMQLAIASRNPEIARAKEREEQMQPLDLENDVPEGFECPMEMLQKLQELRMSRIEFELNIKYLETEVEGMTTQEAQLQNNVMDLASQISELQLVRVELNERIQLSSTNIEVLLKLKQGRDEVKPEAVVTDYSDSLVIPEAIVSVLNSKIRELGEDKIGVLTKIKDFNKEINHMLWECSYLKMMVRHTEEKYLDYHMLRVTKDLQSFLKGGSGLERQRVAVDKAEATYEYMKKAHGLKLGKLQKTRKKMEKAKRQKQDENRRLRVHVEELERNVSLRASIHRARAAGGDGTMADESAASRKRMQGIVTRRKLIDLARAQTDEIEFLRQELDRLRQRTFPSFASRRDHVGDAY